MNTGLTVPRVWINSAGIAVMKRDQWSSRCPADQLGDWLQFYRKAAKRPIGPLVYAPWVTAIEAAFKSAGLPIPPAPPEKVKAVKK